MQGVCDFFARNSSHFLVVILLCLFFSVSHADSEIEDADVPVEVSDTAYSFYQERYLNNSVTGLIFSFYDKKSTSLINGSTYVGLKYGIFQSQLEQNELVGVPAVDVGGGVSYGKNLFVYSEFGLDLGEIIGGLLVENCMVDHPSRGVDLDAFLTLGIGAKAKRFGVSAYVKLSKITGGVVRDSSGIYRGIKVTYFY